MCSFRIICQNNGTCYLNSSTNVYSCICANNFYGPNCQYGYKPLNSTTFINSTILTQEQGISLLNLVGLSSNSTMIKLYQASKDGFGAFNFHSKVDNISGTFIVIKTTNGNVFGGFTLANWGTPFNSTSRGFVSDPSAYIFSFINQQNFPCRLNQSSSVNSIYAYPSNGPTFGGGVDLYISDQSNSIQSYSRLGSSYILPLNYLPNSPAANSFLAGSQYFLNLEIEVYKSKYLIFLLLLFIIIQCNEETSVYSWFPMSLSFIY